MTVDKAKTYTVNSKFLLQLIEEATEAAQVLESEGYDKRGKSLRMAVEEVFVTMKTTDIPS